VGSLPSGRKIGFFKNID